MTNKRVHPEALHSTEGFGYSHIAVQTVGRVIHVAGQTAWDKDMNLVGGSDHGLQARQALSNLKDALAAVGANPADVVRMRTYVVSPDENTLMSVVGEINAFYGDAEPAPNTFLAIAGLAMPDFLVEIEVTAALAD
ncbi:MAG: RidA family protein [Sphingomonadales bacterium]|nr:MAG: RidA family protein [Sphingomonadales bacterium]